MTWSAVPVVTSADVVEGVCTIVASATAGETYGSQRYTGADADGVSQYEDVEVPRLVSNTEGRVLAVTVTIEVEAEVVPRGVEVGANLPGIHGHFG